MPLTADSMLAPLRERDRHEGHETADANGGSAGKLVGGVGHRGHGVAVVGLPASWSSMTLTSTPLSVCGQHSVPPKYQ